MGYKNILHSVLRIDREREEIRNKVLLVFVDGSLSHIIQSQYSVSTFFLQIFQSSDTIF